MTIHPSSLAPTGGVFFDLLWPLILRNLSRRVSSACIQSCMCWGSGTHFTLGLFAPQAHPERLLAQCIRLETTISLE